MANTTINKANNATVLSSGGSWTGGVVPTSTDVAKWGVDITGANTVSLGSALVFGALRFPSTQTGYVNITTAGSLTLMGTPSIIGDVPANYGVLLSGLAGASLNRALTIGASQIWQVDDFAGEFWLGYDNGASATAATVTMAPSVTLTKRGLGMIGLFQPNPNLQGTINLEEGYLKRSTVAGSNGDYGTAVININSAGTGTGVGLCLDIPGRTYTLTNTLNVYGSFSLNRSAQGSTGGLTVSGPMTLYANANVDVSHGASATISGLISGNFGITKTGTKTLTINNINNTFTYFRPREGTTNYSTDALKYATFDWLTSDAGAATYTGTSPQRYGGLSGNKNFSIGSTSLEIGYNNTNTTYSGVISTTGVVTKFGTGKQTLTGLNTYTGGTTVNSGTLELAFPGVSGNGTINGVLSVNSGSTVLVNDTNMVGLGWNTNKITNLNINKGTTNYIYAGHAWNLTTNLTGATLQSNSGTATDSYYKRIEWGGNTLNVAASDVYSTISGYLHLRPDYGAHIFNVARGTADKDLIISATTRDGVEWTVAPNAITKNGAGIMTITGKNQYSGKTTINSGTLEISGSGFVSSENTITQENLIKNGGFEVNTLVSEWTYNGGAEITGWSAVDVLTKANGVTWTVPANGTSAYYAGIQGAGVIRQTVNFTKTGKYILKWKANGRGGVQVNPYYVTLDGADVGELRLWDTHASTWKIYQQEIDIVTTGNHTIGFRGTAATDLTVFFDNISLAYAEHAQELAINNGSVFSYRSSTDQVLSGPITGNGTLKKYNASSTLSIGSEITSAVTVEAIEGTIKVLPGSKIASTGLTLNGGNLELGNI